jgi:hypothetical protein
LLGRPALRLRSRPLFDPSRKEVHHLGNACRAYVWPPGRCVNPAQICLAIELRKRVEERRRGRVSRERSGDVLSQIGAVQDTECVIIAE